MTHAEIPTIYAFDTPAAAEQFVRAEGEQRLVLMPDREAQGSPMAVFALYPGRPPVRRGDDIRVAINGNYQDVHNGTQYTVLKFCSECRDWKGVDSFLRFTHEEHVRRSA